MEEQNFEAESGGKGRKIMIALLVVLLAGATGLYVSGVSIKSLLFGGAAEDGEQVGVVKSVTGQLKRQPKDSLEFLDAPVNANLYNEDTVMTGPEDRATIELFDGSILELEPGSLIRLTFESIQGAAGIERRVLVDIVAGNVKGDMTRPKLVVRRGGQPVARPSPSPTPSPEPSPEPSPSPSPTPSPSPSPSPSPTPALAGTLKITTPTAGQVFTIPAGQAPPLKQALIFESPAEKEAEVLMVLKNASGKELLKRPVKANRGRGGLMATFERPGNYSLEVRNPDGTPIGRGVRAPFTIAADYEGIVTEAPLVGGEPIDSNQFTGKKLQEFDVVLRWKPMEGIEKYRVFVKNSAGKTLVDEQVTGSTYAFPKGKIHTDPLVYQIRAEYPNGYAAVSKQEQFMFNFNSPPLTMPTDGEAISLADPEVQKQKGIFFSWQRTTFTEAYEFEIAADPQFQKVLKKVMVKGKDNFLIFRNLKPATYYWRVRAAAGAMRSPPMPGFKLVLNP